MTHAAGISISRIGAAALAVALALALAAVGPVMAEPNPASLLMFSNPPQINRHIRMKEGATGAQVLYFNHVPDMGLECPEGSTNPDECLEWYGERSVFEVTLEGVTETDLRELQLGVLAAIAVACPSGKHQLGAPEDVAVYEGHFYTLDATCPAIDVKGSN